MHEAFKWVGIGAAVWIAVSVMFAVLWHRFMKAQPKPPVDRRNGGA